MRRYRGVVSDNERWRAFAFRPDDVVIAAPGKCGTTWMQTMVGMLIFGDPELPAPLGALSPWLDMVLRPPEVVLGRLEAQDHRRFVKTHTPLDGLPWNDTVTYITMTRHPLDVALSKRDHVANADAERLDELMGPSVADELGDRTEVEVPTEAADYLRWWIDVARPEWVDGAGSLEELVRQIAGYWDARNRPNLHLFHYDDLYADLEGQMERLAHVLGVSVDDGIWPEIVDAARIDSMRDRAAAVVAESDLGVWKDPAGFFRSGGRRDWGELLEPGDIAHYRRRLTSLAGPELAAWIDRTLA